MPAFTPQLEKDLEAGKVVLGGCVLSDDDPAWQRSRSKVANALSPRLRGHRNCSLGDSRPRFSDRPQGLKSGNFSLRIERREIANGLFAEIHWYDWIIHALHMAGFAFLFAQIRFAAVGLRGSSNQQY